MRAGFFANAGLIAIVSLLTVPGCGGVECGEGTFRDGDNCIGFDPNDDAPPVITLTPPGQRSRDPIPTAVAITTDELSQLYVTTDGSDPDPTTSPGEPSPATIIEITNGMTLKYMAIDRAGNQSAIESATYISDIVAPGKVKDLVVTPSGTDATITWTNPGDPDFEGTVLARVVDLIDTAPESGQTYAAATDLTSSLQILQVGAGTQFVDANRPPGRVRYVVWSFDDLKNYGQPNGARSQIDLGNLEIEFQYDAPNNTLSVLAPSIAFDTTGTTATNAAGTVTLTLHLKNISTSHFQNPKALVVSTTNASFATTNPTADGLSFVDLGPATFAPNATIVTADKIKFTGVSGIATFKIRLGHHASLISNRNRSREVAFQDSGAVFLNNTLRLTPGFTTLASGPNNNGKIRPPLFTGEHFVDVPTQHGTIERWDMVTQTRVAGVDVGAQNGDRTNVQALLADSGSIYALTKAAKSRDPGKITVIRFDESLRETGRLDLAAVDAQGFTHPALSPDGTTLAIPSGSSILLIDTETMTQRDAVPATPELDAIQTAFTDRVRAVTFFDGGNGLFAVERIGGKAEAIRFADTGPTSTELSGNTTGRGNAVALAPDGRVFVAYDAGLRVYDPTTDLLTTTSYVGNATGLLFADGKLRVLRTSRSTVDVANPSTGAIQVSNPLGFSAFGHWLFLTSR